MKTLRHGTDRAGLVKEIDWEKEGYWGGEWKFEDIIYGSSATEIIRGAIDKDFSTAFKKIPITKDPYILIYDSKKLVQVHPEHQYAFLEPKNKLDALICVLKVKKTAE